MFLCGDDGRCLREILDFFKWGKLLAHANRSSCGVAVQMDRRGSAFWTRRSCCFPSTSAYTSGPPPGEDEYALFLFPFYDFKH